MSVTRVARNTLWALFCFVVLLLTSIPAHAEDIRSVQMDVGFNFHNSGDFSTFEFGGFVGYPVRLVKLSENWGLYSAVGVYAGIGSVTQEDDVGEPRTMDRSTLGVEVRSGFLYDDGWPRFYAYIGGGPVHYYAGAANDATEAWGTDGYRASVGLALPGSFSALAKGLAEQCSVTDRHKRDECEFGKVLGVLGFLFPNRLEVSYQSFWDDPSAGRIGGAFGYSF